MRRNRIQNQNQTQKRRRNQHGNTKQNRSRHSKKKEDRIKRSMVKKARTGYCLRLHEKRSSIVKAHGLEAKKVSEVTKAGELWIVALDNNNNNIIVRL